MNVIVTNIGRSYDVTVVGFLFLGLGVFVGISAMMWCLFKCLGNHCDGNYQDDAEEARVPEEVTDNASRRPPPYSSLFGVKQEDPPPPYSSLFGVKQEGNYEDPPPLYPDTQEKTDSGLIR